MLIRAWGTQKDVSEFNRQKNLEATNLNLKKQRKQLIALNDAKDEFISIASHQLRTPTTTVKQYLGMLLEGYAGHLTDEQLSMIMTAYDNNERQLKIITDLLRVASVDAGKVRLNKAETDLAQLISAVISDMRASFDERKQKVIFNPPASQLSAQIDARLLRMVLENLIENAGKYSPKESTVKVSLGTDLGSTVLQISDNGVGIDKKDQAKLFHKFTRIENPMSASVGGTGLGLYWVKKIIDLHGGSIDIASTAGKGSTFTIKLPR
jgi:signal transduction histidine kinase